MKVTKNILREMIEAEINLLNEATERTGFLNLRGAQKTIEKLGKLLRKYKAATDDTNQQDRRMQRFDRLWSAIKGGIVLSDLKIGDVKTPLGEIVYEAAQTGTPPLISAAQIGLIEGGRTATDRADPDVDRTATQMAAAVSEIEEEETAEETEEANVEDASADESEQAQEGGETEPSAESTAMLTAMAEEGKVLQRGSKSAKVGLLQDALRARLGNMSHQWLGALGDSDNDYGRKTELAVKAVQTKYGLTPDGAAGPNTAASLLANENDTGAPVSRGSGSSSEESTPEAIQLVWDEDNNVHYSEQSHTANNDSGEPTEYNLWIRKGNKDYHANGKYAEVTRAEIEALNESKSIIERFNSYLNEIEFTTGRDVNDVPTEAGEDGEAVTGPVVTVTGGPEAGTEPEAVGEPSEDSINAATEALQELATTLRRQLVIIADENEEQMNKPVYRNTDEALILKNLRKFDNLAEEYYEACLSHVAIFTVTTPIPQTILTPTEYHYNHLKAAGAGLDAVETAQEKRDAVVSWYDTELHGSEYQEMKRIIERNARALTANSSEVMASGATEQQATIASTNTHIRELVVVIKETAKTIGENSYDAGWLEAGDSIGDDADEEAVMTALENFNVAAQEFYEKAAQTISDNELSVPTPSEMLLAYYKRSVTSDDKAESVQDMANQMAEFLELRGHVRILNRNNRSYSNYVSGDLESRDDAITESLSYDRFQKLAGI